MRSFDHRGIARLQGIFLLGLLVLLSACGSVSSVTGSKTVTATAKGTVSVMYAGSLAAMMEHQVGPAFKQATGYSYQGEGEGSVAIANDIKGKLRTPDVFISADPRVNNQLMGSADGNYVSWYLSMARTEMVIGYSPKSRYAADFKAAAAGTKPWYQVLEESGVRVGRTDPLLDPKGYNTLFLFQLAQQYYHQTGLEQKVLGSDENSSQIFPEQELLTRLGTGQIDAGFFYLNEAKQAKIPYINLSTAINLGDPSLASTYATAQWKNPKTNKVTTGAPIIYTVTIPSTVKNKNGAIAFVNYLLSSQGQSIFTQNGLSQTPIQASGDKQAIPQQLQHDIQS